MQVDPAIHKRPSLKFSMSRRKRVVLLEDRLVTSLVLGFRDRETLLSENVL
jgi:hypothetical protein